MPFILHDISFLAVISTIYTALYTILYGLKGLRVAIASKFGTRLPPGPVGLPIVGCLPFLARHPELTLDKWAKKYGPVLSMWLGDQLYVVLSDPHVVKDLVINNGALFNSRKDMFVKSQIILKGRGITATPYNETWRKHRRLAKGFLTQKAVDSYLPGLEHEVKDLIKQLYIRGKQGQQPVAPAPFAGAASLNNILTITFGRRVESIDDPFVAQWLKLAREFMNCTGPVANYVDFVPFLRLLPGTMIQRGKDLSDGLVGVCSGFIKDIKERMQRGEEVPDCIAKHLLTIQEKECISDVDLCLIACAFMIGGVETTASIKSWFAANIPAYPEIQAKAQAELDAVVGRDRLPNAEDEKDLPYIRSIIKEVERCHNPFWLGTPHMNTEDYVYRGMLIPKNTVIILNCWHMHHDPNRYPEPYKFMPERYLDHPYSAAESANLSDPTKRDHWTFGAGRRICPGLPLAETEIFLAVSTLLWAFKMEEVPGAPINLNEYDGLSGRSPVPFNIKCIPRDDRVKEVLGL